MKNKVSIGLVLLNLLFVVHSAHAEERPCGPAGLQGPLRLLIPQGFRGADFRPACRIHDACYDTICSNKATCDKVFLANMQNACCKSRNPIACRVVARSMYFVTRVSGHNAFKNAQNRARSNLGR